MGRRTQLCGDGLDPAKELEIRLLFRSSWLRLTIAFAESRVSFSQGKPFDFLVSSRGGD